MPTAYRFSANTGYLWKELPFPDRIRQAALHGFDGVEFHDEAQSEDPALLLDLLQATGLTLYGLNTRMGPQAGCAALPGQHDQARRDIDAAIAVAEVLGARAIHVLAGITGDAGGDRDGYVSALLHALDATDRMILIEPVSNEQLPGYFLSRIGEAARILDDISHPRLKIMFDCYHIHKEEGDVAATFAAHASRIGHVQISAAEHRAEPFPGKLDYRDLLPTFRSLGYQGAFGCEYRPRAGTPEGLGWRDMLQPCSKDSD